MDGELEAELDVGLAEGSSDFSSIRTTWRAYLFKHRWSGPMPRVFDAEGPGWGLDNIYF